MRALFCVCAGFATLLASSPAYSQQTSPQQCMAFNTLADQHESKADAILKSIEKDTQNLQVSEIARIMQERSAAAGSEQELASLAREGYRKCLTDYLGGGAPQPAAVPQQQPLQQAVPQAPVEQPPVQQVLPAPVQQAPVQQAQPAQQQRPAQQQQRVYRQQ